MIHLFSMNNLHIVVDINSGSIHNVTKEVYDVLNYIQKSEKDLNENGLAFELSQKLSLNITDIEEILEELAELKEEQLLFSQPIQYNHKTREAVVKALCLHIAHDCNLRCGYCFADEGEYKGKKEYLDFETGRKAIDFLLKNSKNRKQLEVDFFGGEPLMNFETVKQLVYYGNSEAEKLSKKIRFTITTNGVLLDKEKEIFINEHMTNVVLSLDGRKEVNDNFRKTAGGNGSYDVILPKFLSLVNNRSKDKSYYVRGTFTRHNLDFSEDVFHLYNAGFQHVSVEPVVGEANKDYTIKNEDLPKIFEEYENLAIKLLNSEERPNFFHFNMDLDNGPCLAKRVSGCGCGVEYLAVTPSGDLYPCHQFVGEEQFKIGNLHEMNLNDEIRENFLQSNVCSNDKCIKCFAKLYCSGGCFANSYYTNGDIKTPCDIACELQKKRTECAIMMKVSENLL